MACWFSCPCLNVKIPCKALPEPLYEKDERFSNLLQKAPNKGRVSLAKGQKVLVCLEKLVGQHVDVSGWVVFHCYLCEMDVYAISRGNDTMIINMSTEMLCGTNAEDLETQLQNKIENLKGKYFFSPSFKVRLMYSYETEAEILKKKKKDQENDIEKNVLDCHNTLEEIVEKYLSTEIQLMNKRIRDFEKLQEQNLLKLKENAYKDRGCITAKIHKFLAQKMDWEKQESETLKKDEEEKDKEPDRNTNIENNSPKVLKSLSSGENVLGTPVKRNSSGASSDSNSIILTAPVQPITTTPISGGSGLKNEMEKALRFNDDDNVFVFDDQNLINDANDANNGKDKDKDKEKGKVDGGDEHDYDGDHAYPQQSNEMENPFRMYACSLPVPIPSDSVIRRLVVRREGAGGGTTTEEESSVDEPKWKFTESQCYNPVDTSADGNDSLISKSFAVPFSMNSTRFYHVHHRD